MSLVLDHIVPAYLKIPYQSDIWKKKIIVEPGNKINIYAPSGMGKTTLLNFISGLKKPKEGNILFRDRNINYFSIKELVDLRRQELSFVFQDLKLIPQLTVEDNILMLNKEKVTSLVERMEHMLEILGILNKKKEKLTDLSHGEKQRVAIIRSLSRPFSFLILDDPFSHLDEKAKEKAFEMIINEAKQKKAAIILLSLEKHKGPFWDKQWVL